MQRTAPSRSSPPATKHAARSAACRSKARISNSRAKAFTRYRNAKSDAITLTSSSSRPVTIKSYCRRANSVATARPMLDVAPRMRTVGKEISQLVFFFKSIGDFESSCLRRRQQALRVELVLDGTELLQLGIGGRERLGPHGGVFGQIDSPAAIEHRGIEFMQERRQLSAHRQIHRQRVPSHREAQEARVPF